MRVERKAAFILLVVSFLVAMSVQRVRVGGGVAATAATPTQSEANATNHVTPWGHPDLQGIWSPGYYLTPLERPDVYGGREFLTDDEVATLEKEQAENKGRDTRLEAGSREDLEGAYNDAFSGRGTKVVRTKRTSLIVDPANGKIPPLTPEAQARQAAANVRRVPAANRPGASTSRRGNTGYVIPLPDGGYPSDNPEDRPPDRCLGVSLPFLKGTSGAFSRIVQTPQSVAIYHEDGHVGGAYREVYLDGR